MIKIFDTNRFVRNEEKQGDIPKYSTVSKHVMKIVWPAMIEAFLVSLVTMLDGIMVSDLGNNANTAITITKQPIFLMICFVTALNIAITTIVARRKGQGRIESANKTMHVGVVIAAIFALFLSGLMFLLAKPVCLFMGATDDTVSLATTYLQIISAGFIFNALRLSINAAQRGMGNTKVSMITNVIANVVNVGLNYLLITGKFGFKAYGIAGAAYATIIGNAVAFVISFLTILIAKKGLKFNFKFLRPNKETLKDIFHIFPSTMVEQAFMRIGFILFAIIVNKMGTDQTYVHGICNDINSLLFTLSDGFAIGTSAIVGHRLGEKRKDLAVVYAKVSIMLSVFCGILICGLMLLVRGNIIMLYKPERQELFDMASNVLIIGAMIMIPQNIQWVITGVLRGSGDTKFTAANSLISVTFVRPIISYLLCYHTPLGLYGAWLGMFADQFLRCVANIWRFKSRIWLNKRV